MVKFQTYELPWDEKSVKEFSGKLGEMIQFERTGNAEQLLIETSDGTCVFFCRESETWLKIEFLEEKTTLLSAVREILEAMARNSPPA